MAGADPPGVAGRPGGLRRWIRFVASHFVKIPIERRTTEHNPLLEVVTVNGRTILNGRTINYSFGGLHRVFDEALDRVDISRRGVRSALLLGYGGGSVACLLRAKCRGPFALTAVEIDPEVIELARAHFGLDDAPEIEVVCGDGAVFVRESRRSFDLIVVDAFVDDRVPPAFETREFLASATSRLEPGGLLLYNRLAHTPSARAESDRFARLFAEVLPNGSALRVQNNIVLVHFAAGGPR